MIAFFWIILAILVGTLGNKRKIGFGWAVFWSLLLSPVIGFIIVLLSDENKKAKYKEHKELGGKAEFKGHLKEALDHYLDSLYHLENDYKNSRLGKKLEEKRKEEIEEISLRIEVIQSKIENQISLPRYRNPSLTGLTLIR